MRKIGTLAALLLLSGPTITNWNNRVVLADEQHGSYVPPYADEDPRDDDEYDHDDEDPEAYKPRHCNVLALSDAQSIGPYQAGVVKELVNAMKMGEQEYEVVSGISVGAINAHILGQYPIGRERDATAKMMEFWDQLAEKNSDLVKSWSWGMIYGFFYENSIYDAGHLYDFIAEFFEGTSLERHVNIGIANVLSGRYHSFGEHHTSEELIKILQASVSYPGVFKSVEIWESLWFTGSAIYEIDVLGPINHCRELGYEDENIYVDAIVSGNPKLKSVFANMYNAFGIVERTTEVMDYYEMIFGVLKAQMGHPKVNFRHIIGPPRKMANRIIPLEFTKEEVQSQIKLGVRDTKLYLEDYSKEQREKKSRPVVQSSKTETNSNQTLTNEPEAAPYHCLVNKRYHNPARQAKYEQECGRFKNMIKS